MIMFLAARLLVRWRRGHFHAHPHRHGATEHRHLHPHDEPGAHDHAHEPEARLGRSPAQAFGIGLRARDGRIGRRGRSCCSPRSLDQAEAVAALVVLALGTAVSMAVLSSAFGYAITRGPVLRRMLAFAPAMGVLTLAFGGWYALGAVGAVPYVL